MLLTWLEPADTILGMSQTQKDECRVVSSQEAPRIGKFIARERIRGSQSWVLGNEEVLVMATEGLGSGKALQIDRNSTLRKATELEQLER